MDILYLPSTDGDDNLQLAIQRMKGSNSRWVVVHHKDGQYRLYNNRAVLGARARGVEQCDGLRDFPGEPVAFLSDDLAKNQADDMWTLVESTLDRYNARYGLPFWQSPDNQVIAVVTRHEGIGYDLRSAECVCACMQGHDYTEPPPVDGTVCPHDGTDIICL